MNRGVVLNLSPDAAAPRAGALQRAYALLAVCIRREAVAAAVNIEAERAIDRAAVAAGDARAEDEAVEAFGAWLPHARRRAELSRTVHDLLRAETARARAAVDLARRAASAVPQPAGAASSPRAESADGIGPSPCDDARERLA